ncbi:hypothetical protein [Cellulophaga sp. Hel_I_12]|uniref:hypothetical protein n=1 Tax=Cellulophaga sp. Hel_I_12 TaxID=1249972 RepID=UPI0006480C2E|nr:hypothetical protein [Cellulophaga sp. Hel_I_12]
MFYPIKRNSRYGSLAVRLELNELNQLKDANRGVKIVANFSNMNELFAERIPVSLRLGAYWIMHPIVEKRKPSDKGFLESKDGYFEHLTENNQKLSTKFIPIHEDILEFDFSDVNYSKEIPLAEPPQRDGFVLDKKILVGFFDLVFFESNLEDYIKARDTEDVPEYEHKRYVLTMGLIQVNNNFKVIDFRQYSTY